MTIRKRRGAGSRGARRAFTLIELLVVVAIIGILAVIALSKIQRALRKAREGSTIQGLAAIRSAVNMYSAICASRVPGPGGSIPIPVFLYDNAGHWDWQDPDDPSVGSYIHADFRPYLENLPMMLVSGNGMSYPSGEPFCRGIWYSNTAQDSPSGLPASPAPTGTVDNRGWFYRRTDGEVFINNNCLSTDGKRYCDY